MRILWQSFVDPVAQAPYFKRLADYLAEIAAPGTVFELRGLTPPPLHVHRITEVRCGAQVVANLIEADAEGFDAAIIGHFQDPGLWDARAAVEMPVLGLGESSMLHACTLGYRVGLVTISPVFIPWHEEQIIRYRLEDRVVAVAALETDVDLLVRGFDEPEARDQIRGQLVGHVAELAARGVQVVIPAGGLPALLFRDEREFQADGATILNPIPLLAKLGEATASLRALNGTGTSRHSTFARPSEEALREYVEQAGGHSARLPGV